MGDASNNTADAMPLDYAAEPNRWRRRSRRAIQFLLLVGLIFAGWRWGPIAWRQATLLYYQRQCLNYTAPPDMVVYESDPVAAKMLLQRPGYAAVEAVWIVDNSAGKSLTTAAYRPESWNVMVQHDPLSIRRLMVGALPMTAICFMGELKTPAGERRLVFVECMGQFPQSLPDLEYATLIAYSLTPAGPFTEPTNLVYPRWHPALIDLRDVPSNIRIFAGQRDLNDPSHFTIRYQVYGQESIIDGWIDNSGRVKVTPRQPKPRPIDPTTRDSQ